MYSIEPKKAEEKHILIANTLGTPMGHGASQHMAKDVQCAEN